MGTARHVRRHPVRPIAALLCGVALAAAFPPYDLWPLSVLSVAGLSVLVHGRRAKEAFGLGFLYGLPFMLWLLDWLRVIGYDAWVALSVIEALYLAVMAAGLALVARLRCWPLWSACLWVTQELVRDRVPFGGFPWGRLAFANTATPYTPLAALAGAPAVTFAVALSGALVAWTAVTWAEPEISRLLPAVARRGATTSPKVEGAVGTRVTVDGGGARAAHPTGRVVGRLAPAVRTRVCAAAALVLAFAVPAAAYAVPIPTAGQTRGGAPEATVAVVQGNVPRTGLDFLGQRRAVLDNHVRETHRLAEDVRAGRVPRPSLVIWPENSSDLDPFAEPDAFAAINAAVKDIGVPVLVGALVAGPDDTHIQNEGIVWDPRTGPGAHYTKRHPVPFGEYIPFREVLTKVISRLKRVPRDFYHGKTVGELHLGPVQVGDVICFEVAYDNEVRDAVTHGGRVIVVQTNNATYGRTGQPEQQLAMSRLRAVEHGRAVLIAATSGISAVIDPDGSVRHRTREFTADTIVTAVPLRDDLTPAARAGAAPEWTVGAIGVLACLLAVALRRRDRRADGRHDRSGAASAAAPATARPTSPSGTSDTRGKIGL